MRIGSSDVRGDAAGIGIGIGIGIAIAIEFARLIEEPFLHTNHASQLSPPPRVRVGVLRGGPGGTVPGRSLAGPGSNQRFLGPFNSAQTWLINQGYTKIRGKRFRARSRARNRSPRLTFFVSMEPSPVSPFRRPTPRSFRLTHRPPQPRQSTQPSAPGPGSGLEGRPGLDSPWTVPRGPRIESEIPQTVQLRADLADQPRLHEDTGKAISGA